MSAEQGSDRLPPQNRDAERSVLGSMLRDNSVIGDVVQILREESFYTDGHRKIFRGITILYDKASPVDLVTLPEWLKQEKFFEDVGGPSYLAELWDAAPTAANAEYYARIVRDKSVVRNLIHAGTEILRDCYNQAQPADELLEGAERKIMDIAQMGVTGQTYTLQQALNEAYDRIDVRSQRDHMSLSGLSTGFLDLDAITAGLQNSELVILAARPSVGKTAFSLNIVRHIAVEEKQPVFFVSLEQSRIELAERLLCSHARVDSHKLRKGHLSGDDMQKLIEAGDQLRQAKLFIDDTPGQGMLRIAANARRLKLRHDIKLVVIDYLQLIDPDNRRDPRQEQVAQISRRLKFLARELNIPVMSLAQVNRSSEDRQDHRPRLSDLRESGCLTGDTLITLGDSGVRVPIASLVGKNDFRVWALNERTMKIEAATVSNAFATGRKTVFRLTTALGRTIRATANHQFRTVQHWLRLDALQVGDYIAIPRALPQGGPDTLPQPEVALLGHLIGDGCTLPRHAIQYTTRELDLAETVADLARRSFGDRVTPRIQSERTWYQVYLAATHHLTHGQRNPVAEWLDRLQVFGLRSWEKFVPEPIFAQSREMIGLFLRHLWATDGCIRPPRKDRGHPNVYYASSSERLARDVQSLLMRLGINGILRAIDQGAKGRVQHQVWITGRQDIQRFMGEVGAVGAYRCNSLEACRAWIQDRAANTNRDIIPNSIWRAFVVPAMQKNGVTMRRLQAGIGMSFMGTGLYKQNVSRERLVRVTQAAGGEPYLAALADSDVYWDRIVSIEPAGDEEVYDLTVPGHANFIAADLIVHNSIEQDADTVMLMHRPELHEPGQHEGVIEIIIAKQRNGPTGEVTLTYLKQYMRYENFSVEPPFSYGN